MKYFLLLLLATSLFANNLLTQYRKHGIEAIEKQLDLALTQKEYWDEELQKVDTNFGYIESYSSVLACDKNSSTLSLFKKDANNTFVEMKTYSAFTGKVSGDKEVEGDLRTPVGIYNLKQRLDKSKKLDPFYGPLAFVTSYPNLYDKMRGKNGSGIWIHGLPINQQRDDFTRGCIAIDNDSIECLDNNINIEKTILIIHPNKTKENITKESLSNILTNLFKWRYAWKYSDFANYIKFYSPNFTKTDGTKLATFQTQKEYLFKKKEDKSIIFQNINILKYPATQNIYQITFLEHYHTKYYHFSGEKLLMIELDNENNIHIFLEN